MYADDTTLYICGVDNGVLQSKIQEDLDRISVWLAQKKLSLNIDKTHFMILGAQQRIKAHDNGINPISLKFNGSALSRVRSTKCLGVIIDENLLWHEHVDFLCKKVIASLSMLKRIRNFLDERDLLLLYNCLIQSQLDYCCEVWGSRYDVHANRLEILQKRAARMILNANFYTPSSELFKRLNLLYRFKHVSCILDVFLYLNVLMIYFKDTFLDVSLSHSFNTRYSTRGNLILPKCNTEYLKKSFIYSAINQWNLLPNHLKEMESIFSFKSNLKQYLLS